MQHLLSGASLEVLRRFARSKVLLAFDYDGTLAPIVDERDRARMAPRTRSLLTRVAARYPCVVISGRAQADVTRRLRGVGVAEIIGNHGLEPWRYNEAFIGPVRSWRALLERALGGEAGVEIEDKIFSLAVHYRHARWKRRAREAIFEAARALPGARIVDGKQVVNVLPEGAPHKGIALSAARARLGCEAAVYVGDDETDEDVFSLGEAERVLGVRVGSTEASRAPYFLREQGEVEALLERLLEE